MTNRTEVERALRDRADDKKRQDSGASPTEDVVERALEVEPGVEWHAGEDAGNAPERSDDDEASGGRPKPT